MPYWTVPDGALDDPDAMARLGAGRPTRQGCASRRNVAARLRPWRDLMKAGMSSPKPTVPSRPDRAAAVARCDPGRRVALLAALAVTLALGIVRADRAPAFGCARHWAPSDRLLALAALVDRRGRRRCDGCSASFLGLAAAAARRSFRVALAAAALRRAAAPCRAAARSLIVAFVADDGRQVAVVPFDLLADQLLDRIDILHVATW